MLPNTVYKKVGFILLVGIGILSYGGFCDDKAPQTDTGSSVAPQAPSNLAANAISAVQVNLVWTDNANNEDGFRIERAIPQSGVVSYSLLATVSANVTSYSDTTVSEFTEYSYRVLAYNAFGDSAFSNVAGTTTLWTISSLDTAGNVGGHTAMTLDLDNKIHISYYDYSNSDLKYITNLTGTWTSAVIESAGEVGEFSDIAVDRNNKIHISYYDRTSSHLKYATNETGVWQASTIDSQGYNGFYSSIGVDSNNKIHIAYYDSANTDLKYATNASGSWQTSTIDSSGYAGLFCSLVVDQSDKVHISYYDQSNGDLKYITNKSGSWVAGAVDSAGNVGFYSDIAIDSNGKAHISYGDWSNRDLKYVTNITGTWQSLILDATGEVGDFTSIAVDSKDNLHISYYDATNKALKYIALQDSGQWSGATVDRNDCGQYSSICLGPNQVHIAYLDMRNWDLKYATNSKGNWQVIPSPSGLAVTAVSPNQIDLTWTDNSGNEDGFRIERKAEYESDYIEVATVISNTTSYSDAGLVVFTIYTYRIKAYSAADNSLPSNEASAQTLYAQPGIADLASPADGAIEMPVTPVLSWQPATNTTSYLLEVAAADNFSLPVVNIEITGTAYTVSGLSNLTTYWWRIKAKNRGGVGDWSAVWSFTTIIAAPDQPVLASPAQSALDVAVNPTLQWGASARAASYRLQLSDSPDFSSTIVDVAGITATVYSAPTLAYLSTYYWRVNAANIGGTSNWSTAFSFTTVVAPPTSAPVLETPANNATWLSTSPVFSWQPVTTALSYRIQVSTASDFSAIVVDQSNIAVTSYQGAVLATDITYYWRMNASNAGGAGPWSGAWSFTTIMAPPLQPVPSSPAQGGVNVSINPTLVWNITNGATSYWVQLSTNSAFTGIIIDQSNITGTSLPVSGLTNLTVYYWRVQASNVAGTSAWSASTGFTTIIAAPALAGLVSPADNASGVALNLTASWSSAERASSYTIQVATDTAFANIVFSQNGAGASVQLSGLSNNTIYYWRVKSVNAGGESNWTAYRSFTTVVATPVLSSPSDNATLIPVNTTAVWNPVSGAVSYQFQLATDTGFANIVLDQSGIAVTSAPCSGLINYTDYYWRVRASNAGGTGNWSNTFKFTTIIAMPDAPVLLSPAQGVTGVVINPTTLQWNSAARAASYRVQVSLVSDFATTIRDQSSISGTSYQISGLVNDNLYYWRVCSVNAAGSSAWSASWSFTTIVAAPSAPSLASPVNGAVDIGITPLLSWNASSNATSYGLQVSTDAGFGTMVINQANIFSASFQTVGALNYLTGYWWRVNATNAGGTSGWSSIWSLTTAPLPPAQPTLSSPADTATGIWLPPPLQWNAASGATSYTVNVATDSGFTSPLTFTSTSNTCQPAGLVNTTTYWWRVRAVNSGGQSAWSLSRSFTTAIVPPTLSWPSNDEINIATNPTLQWNSVSGATAYKINVATDAGFNTIIVNQNTGGGTTSYAVSLNSGVTYWWRVNASKDGVPSDWSTVWNFTTTPPFPSQPQLLSPADVATRVSTSPTLRWNPADYASTYKVELATDVGFSGIVFSQTGIAGTSKVITKLDDNSYLVNNTNYFWHIKSTNVTGDSAWSSTWSFTTIPIVPDQPILASPANGVTGLTTSVVIEWNAVTNTAVTYRLRVASDPFFTEIIVDQSNIAVTSYDISGLINYATEYYYQVKAKAVANAEESDWSAGWKFTTLISTPTLLSPQNGLIDFPSVSPVLSWNPVPGAALYRVQVATDTGFANIIVDQPNISALTYQVFSLNYLSTYYWRVQASSTDVTSDWSSYWNFTTIIMLSNAGGGSWKYYKPITITNSTSAISNYPVAISPFVDSSPINNSGLVASFHFEEPAGTVLGPVYDTSGYAHSATLTNFVSPDGVVNSGKFGRGISFDGGNDYISVVNSPALQVGYNFSVETWVNLTNIAVERAILCKSNEYLLRHYPGEGFSFFLYDGTDWEPGIRAGVNAETNAWYHVVGTWDGTNQRLYVNGSLINSATHSFSVTPTTNQLEIGRWASSNYMFGLIDEVKIYKRTLALSEIQSRYNAGSNSGSNQVNTAYTDIRFVNAAMTQEFSYWQESDNKFWVKIPNLPSGNTVIRMFYGNSSATSVSNGNNTFMFFDDFSGGALDTNKWQASGTYQTVDGGRFNVTGGTGSWNNGMYSKQTFARDNWLVEADFRTYGNSYSTWGVNQANPADYDRNKYPYELYPNTTNLTTYEYTGDTGSSIGTFTQAIWYKLRIMVKAGGGALYYISTDGGNTYQRCRDATTDSTTPLRIGYAGYDRSFYLDNWLVRKYLALEPTVSVGAATEMSSVTNLTATVASNTQIDLAWQDNSDNEDGFKIERSPDGIINWTQIVTAAANSTVYSSGDLTPATDYYYRVRSYNATSGDAPYSEIVASRTSAPGAPSALITTSVTTTVSLQWTDNANNEDGFKVERKISSAGAYSVCATLAANTTSWTDSTVQLFTPYYYRVMAYNNLGDSAPSNEVLASTGLPGHNNGEWAYHRPITVTNSVSALTDYPVAINPFTDVGFIDNNNLVMSWHFSEPLTDTGTTTVDMSGNGYNGTLNNSPDRVTGRFGNAFSCNGSSSYIDIASFPNYENFTVELWLNLNANLTSAAKKGIIGNWANTNMRWILWHEITDPDNTIRANIYRGTTTYSIVSSPLAVGTWYHIILKAEPNELGLIIDNGTPVTITTSGTMNYTSNYTLAVGRADISGMSGTFAYVNAKIDEVKLYNRILSTQEINSHYNGNLPKVKHDYGDIRFTNSDVTAELSYWQESDSKFWVKMPSLATGNTVIRMFYGNPLATATSNGNNVFDFFDDFDSGALDTNKWPARSGTVTVANGVATLNAGSYIANTNFDIRNYGSIAVEGRVAAGATSLIGWLGAVNTDYFGTNEMGTSPRGFNHRWGSTNWYAESANSSSGTESSSMGAFITNWTNVKIGWVSGNRLEFTSYAYYTKTDYIPTSAEPTAFYPYLAAYSGTTLKVDVIKFRKYYASIEPTYTAPGAETLINAVANPIAAVVTDSRVDLAWQDNSLGEDGFKVERSFDGSIWEQIGTAAYNTPAYSDTTVTPTNTYYYRVRSYDTEGDHSWSDVITTTTTAPVAPSNLITTTVEANAITLQWQDNSNNETGFKLERSIDGTNWSVTATIFANAVSYTDAALVMQATYYYRLLSYNGIAQSSYSDVISSTTLTLASAGGGNWTYFRPITITNSGSTLTDYPVAITPFADPNFINNTGLVGSWHFSEPLTDTSTATADSAGYNYTGTLVNSPTRVTGRFGQGLQFSGGNYVTASSFPSPDTFTAELWFYPTVDMDTGTRRGIIGNWETSNSRWMLWQDSTDSTNAIKVAIYRNSITYTTTTAIVTTGQWHYIVIKAEPNMLSLIINNGTPLTVTTTGTMNYTSNYTFYMGGVNISGTYNYVNAQLDEVRICNRAMSASEIAARYNSGAPKVKGDYTDIRFSNSDATAEYSYWQETDSRFWVKIPTLVSGDLSLRMYYGNVSATSSSNINNTFIFGDDFNGATINTAKWVELDTKNAIRQNNRLDLYNITQVWDSALISTIIFTRNANLTIYGKFTTASSVAAPCHMMVGWETNQTTNPFYDQLAHGLYFNAGSLSPIYETGTSYTASGSYGANTTYDVRIRLKSVGADYEIKGGVYQNWTTIYNGIGKGLTTSPLRIAITQYNHTGYFNHLFIRQDVAVEPTASAAGAEDQINITTRFNAVVVTDSQVDLAWQDNSVGEQGFKIERSPDGSGWTQIGTTIANIFNYSDTTVTPTNTYYYRVRSYNLDGDHTWSSVISTTTAAPVAPSNLITTTVTANTITLQWQDNSNNETGFKIERSTNGIDYAPIVTLPANAVSTTDTGLPIFTPYFYRIFAYNGIGDSGYSNVISATTIFSYAAGGNWLYYRPITITNSGSALTDYQVAITPFADANFIDNTGLVGSWHFSEGKWTVAADMSGNNNDGMIYNGNDDPTSGMLSQSGLIAYTAANVCDNNTGTNAWHTDTSVTGSWLQIDLGAGNPKNYTTARLYTASATYYGNYNVQYSDNGSDWYTAATDFVPCRVGWTAKSWNSVGAHRYWRLYLTNTPGGGSWITELEWYTDVSWVDGRFGKALNFDGTNDYVTLAQQISLADTATFTVELWYKGTDTAANGEWGKVLLGRDNTDIWANIVLRNGYVEYVHYTTAWQHNIKSTTMVANNVWHHIVFINRSDKTGDLYIDGVKEVNNSSTAINNPSYPFRIDSFMKGYNAAYTGGTIDEVRIYNRALATNEIALRYNGGTPKVKGDYSDLRFTNNGNTAELSYWQETDNKFWVRMPSLPTGDTVIKMFYGNVSATSSSDTPFAVGGTITYSGGYTIHTFTTSGTFTPNRAGNVEVLVVAGGGSGGHHTTSNGNGGGGGGGVIYNTSFAVAGQAYTVTVGNGGAQIPNGTGAAGNNGQDSVFSSLTAVGGGGGGSTAGYSGKNGGSGGGSCGNSYGYGVSTQTGGYGNSGGNGASTLQPGGGGGGAGSAGVVSSSSAPGGNGGTGFASSISGTLRYYAGGGGGGGNSSERAGDGFDGGGRGAGTTSYYNYNVYTAEVNATTRGSGTCNAIVNTGGGGGGGSYWATSYCTGSGAGGSGIVIIRYSLGSIASPEPAVSAAGAENSVNVTSNLAVVVASGTQADLAWRDNSFGELGFKIERSFNGADWTQIYLTSIGAVNYSDTTVTATNTYYYRVRSYDIFGDHAWSNVITTTTTAPAAPSNLITTTVTASDISLQWQDNSNSEAGFKLESSIDGVSGWAQIVDISPNTTSYIDSGLQLQTTTYYRIAAYNGIGTVYCATVISATTTNMDIVAATGGTITDGTDGSGYKTHLFTSNDTFNVISGGNVEVYAWGGGGAGGTVGGWSYGAAGGAGGAARGTLTVTTGISYSVVVGGGGAVNSYPTGATGGGGAASNNNSDNRYSGGGGGYSGVFMSSVFQANALIIAGGGGGGGSSRAGTGNAGGGGGGTTGQPGFSPYDGKTAYGGNPGTQTAAGADASCDSANTSGGQGALQGGVVRFNSYGGGGGGGYWGGSAGGYSESNTMAGGGGGSGYLHPTLISAGVLSAGSGTTPGDSGNSLRGTAGDAGPVAGHGRPGIIIVRYLASSGVNITGGTIIAPDAKIHTFTSSGAFNVTKGGNIEVLAVAGGGSGGMYASSTNANGGGGAGGVIYKSSYAVVPGSYTVTVGAGGAAVPNATTARGNNGANSTFGSFTAIGGGGGGAYTVGAGLNGGSGGGAPYGYGGGTSTQTGGYGNAGGSIPAQWTGAGGGGAGSAGAPAASSTAGSGKGGRGFTCSISGSTVFYAGGGGGGGNTSEPAGDGYDGGGRGVGTTSYYAYNSYPVEVNSTTKGSSTPNAIANTGGGGGAGSSYGAGQGWSTGSGAGGSGIVIVRYSPEPNPTVNIPTNITAAVVSTARIDLAWQDNSVAESGFKVERSPNGSTGWTQIGATSANVTAFSDITSVTGAGTYYYRIRSYYTRGNHPYSSVISATTVAPLAPSNLITTTATTGLNIGLQWTDNSFGEQGFQLERSLNGTNWTVTYTIPSNITVYTDTGLTNYITYWYRIRAYNGLGTSGYSTPLNHTVWLVVNTTFNPTGSGRTGSIQTWTVPYTGVFHIETWGAQGGNANVTQIGGLGARMRGDFTLTAGQTIQILVGQQGIGGPNSQGHTSGGGGGGTFVYNQSTSTLLIAAGGGGGGYYYSGSGSNGIDGTTGTSGTAGAGGIAGGSAGAGGSSSNGGSSAGYSGDGTYSALSFLNGGTGGLMNTSWGDLGLHGGFGGGGGAGLPSGGGGGYSGGGGGTWSNPGAGGGGGSYNTGTNQSNTGGVRTGSGLVIITN